MHIQTTNDRELWDSFKAGDDRAFSQIYETYADLLFSYGMRFTSNREIVRDTLQELFIKLYKTVKISQLPITSNSIFFCAFRHQLQNELAKVIPSVDITECETTFTLRINRQLDQLIYDEKELNRPKKAEPASERPACTSENGHPVPFYRRVEVRRDRSTHGYELSIRTQPASTCPQQDPGRMAG